MGGDDIEGLYDPYTGALKRQVYGDAAEFMTEYPCEFTDVQLTDISELHQGAVRRAALAELEAREAALRGKQDELESTPGFGSF